MTNNSPTSGEAATTATKPHPTTNRATEAAHGAVDRAATTAATAEDRLRETAAQARVRARDTGERLQQRSEELASQTRRYVDDHPIASLGIAFAAGLVISSLLRR